MGMNILENIDDIAMDLRCDRIQLPVDMEIISITVFPCIAAPSPLSYRPAPQIYALVKQILAKLTPPFKLKPRGVDRNPILN